MKTEQVKEYYNKKLKNLDSYEQKRWFANDIQKAGHEMTLASIEKHALNDKFTSCLELGPGHGTWTEELLRVNPDANYILLDISSEMLDSVKKRFENKNNIKYVEGDFLKFETENRYEYFFSSRAIEYIPETKKVIEKIVNSLKDEGSGFIITKTPKYLRARLLGRKVAEFHSGQIDPNKLAKEFKRQNCKAELFPVTMSFPVLKSPKLNLFLYKIFSNFKLNFVSQFFSESYCIKFKK